MSQEKKQQSHEKYLIKEALHQMIRSSPHNVKYIESQINADTTAPAAPAVTPLLLIMFDHIVIIVKFRY